MNDDLISRQAAIDAVRHAWAKGLEPSQYIEDLPSVQPEERTEERTKTHACDYACDCISRQDAIRWVKTECNPYGKPTLDFESGKRVMEHLKTMPSVQPVAKDINVSCKDAISRQDAIDAVDKLSDKPIDYLESAIDVLVDLPSVQPDIIRCKDCKHKGTKNCVANAWTTIFGVTVKDDFYCGLAERGTDEPDDIFE